MVTRKLGYLIYFNSKYDLVLILKPFQQVYHNIAGLNN